jgi:hypothetical protein
MSVMKRKLFNREARDELRRMGGIMASSEPLMMAAAQGYAPGGVVEPQQVFTPRSGLGSNINYTYADFLQENGLNDSPQAREMFVKYQQYVASQLASGELTDPQIYTPDIAQVSQNLNEPPMSMDAPPPMAGITAPSMPAQPYTASGTARGSGIETLAMDTTSPSSAVMASVPVTTAEELITSKLDPVAQAREDEINRLLAVFDDPERTEAQVKAARQRLEQIGARDRLISAGIDLGEIVGDRIASDAAGIYGVAGSGANLLGLTDAATTLFEMQKEAEAKVSPAKPDAAEAAGEVEEVVEEAEAADEVEEVVEEAAAPKFPTLQEFMTLQGDRDKRETIQEQADEVLPEIDKDIKDADTEEKFDSVFDKYVEKFSKILGEDPEKAEKDKAFAMAMFGATYASTGDFGQATSVMIDMLRGDNATRQERKDKIKMLALQAGLDEEADRRRLKVAEAKELRDEERQIRVYETKLRLKSKYDDPTGYLDTELGDYVAKIYSEVLTDETLNEEEKGDAFLQRVGPDNAANFFRFTNIPPLGTKQGGGSGADWFGS